MKHKITEQQKQEAIALYLGGQSAASLCAKHQIPKSTFYNWVKHHKVACAKSTQSIAPIDVRRLQQNVTKLENMVTILQTVDCLATAPLKNRLSALAKLHGQYETRTLCAALNVDRGTFYNHLFRNKKQNTTYQARRAELSVLIETFYHESNQIYGAGKIHAVLKEQGEHTTIETVRELMQEKELYSIRTNAKKAYKKLHRTSKADKLKLDFSVSAPNQVWVSDTTTFKINNRPLYICAIIDLYARKVIAYRIRHKHSTQLITSTIKDAYQARQPKAHLIFHSDRGAQYTANATSALLQTLQMEQSFSPVGSPYNNSVMESFFASLKKEEIYRTEYTSEAHFKTRIATYIDFYNNKRPHSTIAHKTPTAYEQRFFQHS